MTEQCDLKWSPSQYQIDKIIVPAMQSTAQQYADYANKLQCPPEFIALMLRDVADVFEENGAKVENSCDCC